MNRQALMEKARDKSWRMENLYVLPIIGGIAAVVAFTLLDWTPPINADLVRGTAEPAQVHKAGVYCIKWEAERRRVCRREAQHSFVDSTGYIHDPKIPPGFWDAKAEKRKWDRCYYAPAGASLGAAQHLTTISFFCNPLHNWWPITVELNPVAVEVIAREEEKK